MKKNGLFKKCLYCDKDFWVENNKIKRGWGKWCSRDCRFLSYKLIEKFCELCDKVINITPNQNPTWYKKKRFCSRKCAGIHNAAPRKKRNPQNEKWQRWLFRRELQKQIFKRDNYTCQLCGSKGELQVDHIQSWAEYIEMRFNIDNCRTVCSKCHYKITFGKPMPKHIKTWGRNFRKAGGLP